MRPAIPSRLLFVALLLAVAIPSPWSSPALALAVGVGFGLLVTHPFPAGTRSAAKLLLQLSVVALGFAMDLAEVLRVGRSGFLYTLAGITFALGLGALLGRLLGVRAKVAYLISVGTAICGGSAIAAVGPTIDASGEELSVSIGTVFLLNALGLLIFPPIGHALGLTEPQFGLWAALAIHDTSSVVGAGARFGAVALAVATTVKLARALWIVPLTLATAAVRARRDRTHAAAAARVAWPWFILGFLGAAVLATYVPAGAPVYRWLLHGGHVGLTATLFLIGTGISRASLRAVGARPLLQGVLLWLVVATVTVLVIRAGWIGLDVATPP